jgi:ferredoxin
MKTVALFFNGRQVEVPRGTKILEAAEKLGLIIPTLCYLKDLEAFTSCLVCLVHETVSDRLIPACSAPAAEGMRIETDSERVRLARRDVLEFLLGEHAGDCEAPCRIGCPAGMDIPKMIRQIRDGRFNEAIRTVLKDIALPAVLGRICPAPCENACKRRPHDEAVSICSLKRFAADWDMAQDKGSSLPIPDESGKKVAVVGAGAAGLAAAYYLRVSGHGCDLYDRNALPGGALRYAVPEDRLPRPVLNREIERIFRMGVSFFPERILGENLRLEDLRRDYDAVFLAVGEVSPDFARSLNMEGTARGLAVDRKSFASSLPGVFAGGNVLSPSKMAVRAAAHGKGFAESAHLYLGGRGRGEREWSFNSKTGRLEPPEFAEMLKEAEGTARVEAAGGFERGFTSAEARAEAARCFGCDCRKRNSCRLRDYADLYGADSRRISQGERGAVEKIIQHERVIYQPGKCIRCGLCVRITEKSGQKYGLAFVGRGYGVRVEAPFSEPFGSGISLTAEKCVAACPTAALSFLDRAEETDKE